jgi:predicted histidine transporter YuiF (NhaC family)
LYVLTRLRIDRRLIACVITFGLITPYMFLPVGFGNIFLNEILLANVARAGDERVNVTHAMAIPALACSSACCWRCSSAIARSATTTWRVSSRSSR